MTKKNTSSDKQQKSLGTEIKAEEKTDFTAIEAAKISAKAALEAAEINSKTNRRTAACVIIAAFIALIGTISAAYINNANKPAKETEMQNAVAYAKQREPIVLEPFDLVETKLSKVRNTLIDDEVSLSAEAEPVRLIDDLIAFTKTRKDIVKEQYEKLHLQLANGKLTQADMTKTEINDTVLSTQEKLYQDLRTLEKLPMNGRRFQDFVTLTPGELVDGFRGQISLGGLRGMSIFQDTAEDLDNNKKAQPNLLSNSAHSPIVVQANKSASQLSIDKLHGTSYNISEQLCGDDLELPLR